MIQIVGLTQVFRRSLYFVKNKLKGQKIKEDDIRRIRPGYGLSPRNLDSVLGQTLLKDVERGDPVKWEYFC